MTGENERRREQAEAQNDHEKPAPQGVMFQADPALERAVGQASSDGGAGGHEGHPHEQVREHMEVIGADGVHLGTVDAVEGERIKLTRADSAGASESEGRHHYLPVGLVAAVEGDRVRLSANADVAYGMAETD